MAADVSGRLSLIAAHDKRLDDLEKSKHDHSTQLSQLRLDMTVSLHGLEKAIERCERPLKTIAWISRGVGSALIVLIVAAVFKMFALRSAVPEPAPAARSGERMGVDRVPDPPAPEGQHHP